jgi:Tfp pilus assembly protein PilF
VRRATSQTSGRRTSRACSTRSGACAREPALARDKDESVNLDARGLRGLGYVDSGLDSGARLDPLEPSDRPGPVERKQELALFESAGAASSEGRVEAAVALWAELVGRYPENLTARSLWASDLIRLQRPAEALPLFEFIASQRSLTANESNNLGWCREQAGDKSGARAAYARALELDPLHPWAKGNLDGRGKERASGDWANERALDSVA